MVTGGRVVPALRSLSRARGFTLVATMTLALGIAGTSVVASVASALLGVTPPYRDPESVVVIQPDPPEWSVYVRWREESSSFLDLGAYNERSANVVVREESQRIVIGRITERFLRISGAAVALGRAFAVDEFRSGHGNVALLTDEYWRRRCGAVPQVVGGTITIDDVLYTVVGVLSPGFVSPTQLRVGQATSIDHGAAVLVPLTGNPWLRDASSTDGGWRGLVVVGRMRPGLPLGAARAEVNAIASRVESRERRARDYVLLRLRDYMAGDTPLQVVVMTGAVLLLLLVATVNVANMVAARGLARSLELGTRIALGASKRQLVMDTLAETMLVAAGGGAAGILLASGMVKVISRYGGDAMSGLDRIALDIPTMVVAAVVSAGAGVMVGVLPALRAARVEATVVLGRPHGARQWAGRAHARSVLVVAEVALAVVLMVCGGMLGTSFLRLAWSDLGFRTSDVLTADISLSASAYPTAAEARRFYRRLLQSTAALPGVTAAAIAGSPPSAYRVMRTNLRVGSAGGISPPRISTEEFELCELVMGEYFRLLDIQVVYGRSLNKQDDVGANRVVVVNEAFARKYWGPDANVLGYQVFLGGGASPADVVGVVRDVLRPGAVDHRPAVYVPLEQFPGEISQVIVLLRGGSVAAMARPLRDRVRELDPRQPVYNVLPLEKIVWGTLARRKLIAILVGVFAIVAGLVAGVGIYGVASYSMSERRHEFGVRLAIGASPRRLFFEALSETFRLVAVGVAAGVIGSLMVSGMVGAQVFGVGSFDLPSCGLAIAVALSLGLTGTAVPAYRAVRSNPLAALRLE